MKLVYDNKIKEIEDERFRVDLQEEDYAVFKDTVDVDKIFVEFKKIFDNKIFVEFKKIFDNVEHRHSEYYGDYITISIL